MHFIIYKTTHIETGKYYIGMHSTSNLNDGYLGSGKWIKAAVKKYGINSFHRIILKEVASYDAMRLEEQNLVNEDLLKDSLCMNLMYGGKGGWNTLNDSRLAYERRSKGGKKAHENHPNLIKNLNRGSSEKTTKTIKQRYGDDYFSKIGSMKIITNEYKEKLKIAQRDMKMINNGVTNTFVKKEELNEYLSNGWVLGRIKSQ